MTGNETLPSHSLALYIFYSNLYLDEQKSYPKYDLIIAAVLAFIWLCAASAWAHAVLGLRSIADVEVRLEENSKAGLNQFLLTRCNCEMFTDTQVGGQV